MTRSPSGSTTGDGGLRVGAKRRGGLTPPGRQDRRDHPPGRIRIGDEVPHRPVSRASDPDSEATYVSQLLAWLLGKL